MSTRCQIEFKHSYSWMENDKKKTRTDRLLVYRHSDGYPEDGGVIGDLQEFLLWNRGRNGDIEYCVANFIYWSKRKQADMMETWRKEKPHIYASDDSSEQWDDLLNPADEQHRGYGVCPIDCYHGDIEWFYLVTLDEKVITIEVFKTPHNSKRKDFVKHSTLKVNVDEEQKRLAAKRQAVKA